MPKYYIGKLVGLKDDFKSCYPDHMRASIYEAPKDDYGSFIFTRTVNGYKEIVTGKTFKYIELNYSDSYPYIVAPINTGLFVNKDKIIEIPSNTKDEIITKYREKYNKEQLANYFDRTKQKCDRVLPTGNNKSEYFMARVVGLKDNFKPIRPDNLSYSIFEAPKDDYGEYIFTKTLSGYKEILTGKTFKFQVTMSDDTGYPVYNCPKDTGLLVDKNTEHMIPKALLKDIIEEYKSNNNSEDLSRFFEEIQEKTDKNLSGYFKKRL